VTLKVISEKYIGDESAWLCLLREARAAVSVRHTNVASVFRLGRTGDDYFYAMEFVEGETLEKLIKRLKPAQGKVGDRNRHAGCRAFGLKLCSPDLEGDRSLGAVQGDRRQRKADQVAD
jgi:serine/threonine protein kinase